MTAPSLTRSRPATVVKPLGLLGLMLLIGCGDIGFRPVTEAPAYHDGTPIDNPPSNSPPVCVKPIDAGLIEPRSSVTLDLNAYCTDPDDDVLAYAILTASYGVTAELDGSLLTITGRFKQDNAEVGILAWDDDDASTTAGPLVTVNQRPVWDGPADLHMSVGRRVTFDLARFVDDDDVDAYYRLLGGGSGLSIYRITRSRFAVEAHEPGAYLLWAEVNDGYWGLVGSDMIVWVRD